VSLKNVDTTGTQPFGVAVHSLKSFAFAQPKAKTFSWNNKDKVSLLATLPGNLNVDLLT
jgi:hypothetical protein